MDNLMLWIPPEERPEDGSYLFRYDIRATPRGYWDTTYDAWADTGGYHVAEPYLNAFKVVKNTPCGWRIQLCDGEVKLVLRSWNKRYAYPTRAEAMESLIARRERQIRLLKDQLARAVHELECLENR